MNTSSTEYEIKASVSSMDDITDLLHSLAPSKTQSDTDVYFDTAQHQLFTQGIFLRLRNSRVLEIKHNPDTTDLNHVTCEEHKYSWPIDSLAKQSITAYLLPYFNAVQPTSDQNPFPTFSLAEFVTIVKHRTVYNGPGIEVSVDRVDGLGLFIEIEAKGPDGVRQVTDYCAKHSLVNIPIGYVELWLRKNDFTTYMSGRFLLKCDRLS